MLYIHYPKDSQNPVVLAAQELGRYLREMGKPQEVTVEPGEAKGIFLRVMTETEAAAAGVTDAAWDDAYNIELKSGCGFVIASNPRSVLLGVYRLLREAGCVFLRPGPDSECIPQLDPRTLTIQLQEKAMYRHRGLCIEGACSLEHVLEMVKWAPKLGYNAYYTQFREAFTFFQRWYTHQNNPNALPQSFEVEDARRIMDELVQAIKERGLLYHAVGHGWTCEPLGIPGLRWEPEEVSLTPEQSRHLAQVNGKRELWHQIPLNTNLCYGNPETRELLVNAVVDYVKANPAVDVLHFWLADDNNNQCECPLCANSLPSDAYVRILNQLDERPTEMSSPVRIVFLLYFDLLWPPATEKVNRPERFILMFAPITRTYEKSLDVNATASMPAYVRNRLRFSDDIGENLAFLRAWQQFFSQDSFDYDYHLYYPLAYDMGQLSMSRVLYEDISQLESLGLNGMVHCMVQRLGIPHGWALYMAGLALWSPEFSYEQARDDYFKAAFGKEWKSALDFCETASALFPMDYLSRKHHGENPDFAAQYVKLRTWLQQTALPRVEEGGSTVLYSWVGLRFWRGLLERLAEYLRYRCLGQTVQADTAFLVISDYVWEWEPRLHHHFDAFTFLDHTKRRQ